MDAATTGISESDPEYYNLSDVAVRPARDLLR